MLFTFRRCLNILALLAFGASHANAQLPIGAQREIGGSQPVMTTSFEPLSTGGPWGAGYLRLTFRHVNFGAPAGPVFMESGQNSEVLFGGIKMPNGIYTVQFTFVNVLLASTLEISRAGAVLSQCNLQANNTWTEQNCESGPFEVNDGQFPIGLRMVSGPSALLIRLTVTQYPPPAMRVR